MIAEFQIQGQDFKKAGEASFEIKNRLKRLGLPPVIIRRVATASYEAELNVIVYAHKGTIRVDLGDQGVEVKVTDEGPGIPDIAMAMQEGYSTAPPYVKQLGYGSGMGLPNIKKNSDWMEIQSEVNRGTTLRFRVNLNESQSRDR
ncbi:MAG: ATP-binding protein [Deltaproteobacteria bacterium]|jgi:anti-sigma regulatory factor (Ser/Thr protein kinase)|nr:ATP-binding protein [Deltaproteobacteria bacterium]